MSNAKNNTPSLFDDGDDAPEFKPVTGAGSIQQRFEQFHRLNPWVYAALERLATEYVGRGRKRIGIRMLWEVVRWNFNMRTTDPTSEFRTNDHFHSRYVRLLVEKHPEWNGLFEMRKLRAS
jgi:hypothetical protein